MLRTGRTPGGRAALALGSLVLLLLAAPTRVAAQQPVGDTAQDSVQTASDSEGRGCGGCQRGCGQGMGQPSAGCGKGQGDGAGGMRRGGPGKGMHRVQGGGPGQGMGQGKGCMVDGNCAMRTAMSLVHDRAGIERTVEEIEGGVRTITTAQSAELAETIERHVREVQQLLERGGALRMWDPLFATIFEHHDQIDLQYERIENGVVVTETSEDPWVAELIRAHAQKVNDFLARGPEAVHEATEVPPREPGPGDLVGSTEGGQ